MTPTMGLMLCLASSVHASIQVGLVSEAHRLDAVLHTLPAPMNPIREALISEMDAAAQDAAAGEEHSVVRALRALLSAIKESPPMDPMAPAALNSLARLVQHGALNDVPPEDAEAASRALVAAAARRLSIDSHVTHRPHVGASAFDETHAAISLLDACAKWAVAEASPALEAASASCLAAVLRCCSDALAFADARVMGAPTLAALERTLLHAHPLGASRFAVASAWQRALSGWISGRAVRTSSLGLSLAASQPQALAEAIRRLRHVGLRAWREALAAAVNDPGVSVNDPGDGGIDVSAGSTDGAGGGSSNHVGSSHNSLNSLSSPSSLSSLSSDGHTTAPDTAKLLRLCEELLPDVLHSVHAGGEAEALIGMECVAMLTLAGTEAESAVMGAGTPPVSLFGPRAVMGAGTPPASLFGPRAVMGAGTPPASLFGPRAPPRAPRTPGTAPPGTARAERVTLALALEHLPLRILSLPILGNSLAPPATTRALRRAAVRCLTTLLGAEGGAEALLLEHDADAQGEDLWAAVLKSLETMSLEGQRRGHGQAAGHVNGRGLAVNGYGLAVNGRGLAQTAWPHFQTLERGDLFAPAKEAEREAAEVSSHEAAREQMALGVRACHALLCAIERAPREPDPVRWQRLSRRFESKRRQRVESVAFNADPKATVRRWQAEGWVPPLEESQASPTTPPVASKEPPISLISHISPMVASKEPPTAAHTASIGPPMAPAAFAPVAAAPAPVAYATAGTASPPAATEAAARASSRAAARAAARAAGAAAKEAALAAAARPGAVLGDLLFCLPGLSPAALGDYLSRPDPDCL
jgi:hypothetical protein